MADLAATVQGLLLVASGAAVIAGGLVYLGDALARKKKRKQQRMSEDQEAALAEEVISVRIVGGQSMQRDGVYVVQHWVDGVEQPASPDALLVQAEAEARERVKHLLLKTEHTTGWDDVIGNDAARRALIDAVEQPMMHAALFAAYGRRPAKGCLLFGPPGCGKTMLGKATAAALARLGGSKGAPATMLKINGTEIHSAWWGAEEATIRACFAYARAYRALHKQPLVIFIDEADGLLPSREGRHTTHVHQSVVGTFLAEMDGLEDSGAFVILATNRPHALDAALLRDGRCERRIRVERPGPAEATIILSRALSTAPLASGSTLPELVAGAVDGLFHPDRRTAAVTTSTGRDFLRLADVSSGALVVGLAERAKAIAFDRDVSAGIAAGQVSGVSSADLDAAIDAIHAEAADLVDSYALEEYAERTRSEIRSVEPLTGPAPAAVAG